MTISELIEYLEELCNERLEARDALVVVRVNKELVEVDLDGLEFADTSEGYRLTIPSEAHSA